MEAVGKQDIESCLERERLERDKGIEKKRNCEWHS